MRSISSITNLLTILFIVLAGSLTAATPDSYAPLWLYNGTWQITRNDGPAGAKPETLLNECARIGKYFGCQQTSNGSVVALMIFIPGEQPGRYNMQSILPGGRATGLNELQIDGDQWTFTMGRLEGGKTMHYRTINTFTGKTKIHFEQAESADGKQWKVTATGEEVKIAPSKAGAKGR